MKPLPAELAALRDQITQQLHNAEQACRDAYQQRDALLQELLTAGYSQRQAGALLGISGPRVARISQRL